jgi:secreted trypsin-like serine protease
MAIRTLLVGLLVPAFVTASILPQPGRNDTIRILGGVDAKRGDFPYAVSLRLLPKDSLCTGSLLDATTVMTAAHCIKFAQEEGFSPSDISVRVGSLVSICALLLPNLSHPQG